MRHGVDVWRSLSLSSFLLLLCWVRNKVMCVLLWQTVSMLTRVLFWCLFPSLLHNSGNTKITLSWALKEFIMRLHTSFSITPLYHSIRGNEMAGSRDRQCDVISDIPLSLHWWCHMWHTCISFMLVSQLEAGVNTSPPSAAYMRQWNGSALVQIMACLLFNPKPLSKPTLGYCQLD